MCMMRRNAFVGLFAMCLATGLWAQSKVHVSEIEERNVDGRTVIYSGDQRLNGTVYEDYVSKKLRYSVKNGIKEGPYELYYENGQLKRKTSFKNDRYDGLFEEYYENG